MNPPTPSRSGGLLRRLVEGFKGRPKQDEAEHPGDALEQLLLLQSADGWFEWDPKVVGKLVPKWKQWETGIEASLAGFSIGSTEARTRLTHTAIVVSALARRCKDREDLWKRAVAKAHRWMASVIGSDVAGVRQWLDELSSKLAD
jgi:hypothetical protein